MHARSRAPIMITHNSPYRRCESVYSAVINVPHAPLIKADVPRVYRSREGDSPLCGSRRRFASILLLIILLLIGARLELIRGAIAAPRVALKVDRSDRDISTEFLARKSRCFGMDGFNRNVASKFLHCARYDHWQACWSIASPAEALLRAMWRKLAVINRASHVKTRNNISDVISTLFRVLICNDMPRMLLRDESSWCCFFSSLRKSVETLETERTRRIEKGQESFMYVHVLSRTCRFTAKFSVRLNLERRKKRINGQGYLI